jgi:vancomycin aglycone glucosyltransferase
MRALLSTYGSRENIESIAGVVMLLGAPGAESRIYAPPAFSDLFGFVGVPSAEIGVWR